MITKQKRLIIILLAAAVLLGVLYLVLRLTVLKPDPNGQGQDTGSPVPLYGKLENADIDRVEVTNAKGSYVLYQGTDSQFYFEGAEHLIYDSYMLSILTNSAKSPTSLRTVEGYKSNGLAIYGLEADAQTATVKVTEKSGAIHTVRVGAPLVNNGGYYAMVEGDDNLYVIDNFYTLAAFADIREFIAPQATLTVSYDQSTKVDEFTLIKNGKTEVRIVPSQDNESLTSAYYAYEIVEPVRRWVNNIVFSQVITGEKISDDLSTMGLSGLVGDRVVEYSVNDKVQQLQKYVADPQSMEPSSPEARAAYDALVLFQKYGLINDDGQFAVVLDYSFGGTHSYLIFSEVNADGKAFAYSQGFDVIVEFDAETVPWVFWDIEKFAVRSLYSVSIFDLKGFKVASPSVNADIQITSSDDGSRLVSVKDALSGKDLNGESFKQVYKSFLFMEDLGLMDPVAGKDPALTVTVELKTGEKTEFSFYDTDGDRKSWYTVNGENSGHYVNRDYVKDIVNYTAMLLNGETFTSSMR